MKEPGESVEDNANYLLDFAIRSRQAIIETVIRKVPVCQRASAACSSARPGVRAMGLACKLAGGPPAARKEEEGVRSYRRSLPLLATFSGPFSAMTTPPPVSGGRGCRSAGRRPSGRLRSGAAPPAAGFQDSDRSGVEAQEGGPVHAAPAGGPVPVTPSSPAAKASAMIPGCQTRRTRSSARR